LSNIDFENKETQRATWTEIRHVVFKAITVAVSKAQAVIPTDDANDAKIRDGMVLSQLHMILAGALGETEGKILRYTMTTDEEITKRRQEYLEAGRVGVEQKT
jgi:hypothetical protein